jgi:hypothetical protein
MTKAQFAAKRRQKARVAKTTVNNASARPEDGFSPVKTHCQLYSP